MSTIFRTLLAIYSFCLSVISAIVFLITVEGNFLVNRYLYIFEQIIENNTSRIIMMIVSLIFFILSIMFLLSGLKSGKDKRAVSKKTEIGEIKISLDSIESIALRASKKVKGISSSKAFVLRNEEDVSITIRMEVLADVNIPAISQEMQSIVKKDVESSSGVKVVEVKVLVENISVSDLNKTAIE